MSEYQYYQFQAIDKPLTPEAQETLSQLSSRVELSPYSAVFLYHYSSLRAEPKQLLADYFDAFFYIANWGSTQLMFRFPRDMVDINAWMPYEFGRSIKIEQIDEWVVLELHSYEEDDSYGWIEDGADHMPPLAQLREDLLNGDNRILYLAWLRATQQEVFDDDDTSMPEPPVPAGLQTLSPALKHFVESFHVDNKLLTVAAETSLPMTTAKPSANMLAQAIAHLPAEYQTDVLVRLAQGEKGLNMELRQKLKPHLATTSVDTATNRRTLDELRQQVKAKAEQKRRQKQKKYEAVRLAKLERLAKQEKELWKEIIALIETKNTKNYDQAVAHLVDLRELAEHQQAVKVFNERVQQLADICAKRPGVLNRMRDYKLIA